MESNIKWHGPVTVLNNTVVEKNSRETVITDNYEGTNDSMLELQDSEFAAGADTVVQQRAGPVYSLTSKYIDDSAGLPLQYELSYEKVNKDILESGIPAIKKLTLANIQQLQRYVNDPQKYSTTPLSFTGSITEKQDAALVYSWISAGQKSIVEFFPVLKVNYYCSPNYNIPGSTGTYATIISTATLVTTEDVPPAIANLLPASGDYATITGKSLGSGQFPAKYGWMVYNPTIQQASRDRLSVSSEYHFGLWNEGAYNFV